MHVFIRSVFPSSLRKEMRPLKRKQVNCKQINKNENGLQKLKRSLVLNERNYLNELKGSSIADVNIVYILFI